MPDQSGLWNWRSVGRSFDAVAERHATFLDGALASPFDRQVRSILHSVLARAEPGDVLDLGCGAGSFATIAVENYHTVHLVDAAGRMLELARERCRPYGVKGLRFTHGDALNTLFTDDATYDVVLAIGELVSYVESVPDLLNAIARRMRPGGAFLGTYIRRSVMLSRLDRDEVLTDDGRTAVFLERAGGEGVPPLWARAIDDDMLTAEFTRANLVLHDLLADPASACGGFLASTSPGYEDGRLEPLAYGPLNGGSK